MRKAETTSCLRCGKCVEVCPVGLLPTRLARLGERGMAAEAKELGIDVCMECGCCAFTCPAGIPLVQWLRLCKQRVRELASA